MPRASATSAPIRLGTTSMDVVETAGLAGLRGNGMGWVGGAVMIVSVGAERMGWSESAAGDAVVWDSVQHEVAESRGHRSRVELGCRHRGRRVRVGVGLQGADLRAVVQHDPAGLDR